MEISIWSSPSSDESISRRISRTATCRVGDTTRTISDEEGIATRMSDRARRIPATEGSVTGNTTAIEAVTEEKELASSSDRFKADRPSTSKSRVGTTVWGASKKVLHEDHPSNIYQIVHRENRTEIKTRARMNNLAFLGCRGTEALNRGVEGILSPTQGSG